MIIRGAFLTRARSEFEFAYIFLELSRQEHLVNVSRLYHSSILSIPNLLLLHSVTQLTVTCLGC